LFKYLKKILHIERGVVQNDVGQHLPCSVGIAVCHLKTTWKIGAILENLNREVREF
jgi:hypothetical protein